jgi:hypothetical protein
VIVRTRLVAAALVTAMVAAPAPAAAQSPTLGEVVVSGLHNSYQKSAFPRMADALATGVGMIEIDVWTTFSAWTVNHDHPFWNNNNCTNAAGSTDQRLESCVDNIGTWHDANPNHRPLLIKLELKAGFQDDQGVGPDELDAVFRNRLGGAMYRPADLMGGTNATPDAAARANAWASAESLRGRVILMVLKGTVENDALPTEVEYARHLAANPASAVGFPFVHDGIQSTDPRTRYEAALRPWFVVFDGGANTFVNLPQPAKAFYVDNHYLTVTTNSHEPAPALSATNPTTQQATDRLRMLGCHGSSVASSDWYRVPGWHVTAPRGC